MDKKVLKQAGVVHTILNHSRTIKIVIYPYRTLDLWYQDSR